MAKSACACEGVSRFATRSMTAVSERIPIVKLRLFMMFPRSSISASPAPAGIGAGVENPVQRNRRHVLEVLPVEHAGAEQMVLSVDDVDDVGRAPLDVSWNQEV